MKGCCGFRRIYVTSKSVKNLVLYNYRCSLFAADDYIDTLEINASYILSLTIEGDMYLKELLLKNVSSLVKADLNYWVSYHFVEEFLRGLLSSLGHVNEIVLGDANCLQALSRLEAKGFQFRKGSDLISRGTESSHVNGFFTSAVIWPCNSMTYGIVISMDHANLMTIHVLCRL
ncbi:hypothetical protein Tco_0436322 [Tanacetum coccineum]